MAFNREKTMATAQKHLRAGKVDKAIKEFERILEQDPTDVRSKLKMADLYVKGERFDEALSSYSEVAYSYAKEDLYEKAAAVYKQAMRISPEDPMLYTQLGEAYFRLGRLKDAVRVFHKAQKIHKEGGDIAAQRDVLERMVRIDPDDVGLQIQLAERYEKDQLHEEALRLFREAATQLKEEGRLDEYVQVAERMIYLSPNVLTLRKEVVRIYLGRGDEKHALKHLQYCFKVNPQDIDTLELLGSTFHRLGSNDKAVLVYTELAELYAHNNVADRAASAYRTVLGIDPKNAGARRYLGHEQPAPTATPAPQAPAEEATNEAVYELDMDEFEEDALDGIEFLDDEDDEFEEIVDESPTDEGDGEHGNGFMAFAEDAIRDLESEAFDNMSAYPEASLVQNTAAVDLDAESVVEEVEVPMLAIEAHDEAEIEFEGDGQILQFLTESDVFLKYGLLDRAEEVITKVLQLAPDNLGGREQMRKLLIKTGDKRGAAHQLVEMARITQDEPERADHFLEQAGEMVDADTLQTLVLGAGLDGGGDLRAAVAPDFIAEVSEGLVEISSVVEDVGSFTIDIDVDPSVEELVSSSFEEEHGDLGSIAEVTAAQDDDLSDIDDVDADLDDVDADLDDFSDLDMDLDVGDLDVGGVSVGEMEIDGDLSLDDADDIDMDLDNVGFDESTRTALKALDASTGDGEMDLDFSAEDADAMFDELFGGGGGGFFDDAEDGVDALDLDLGTSDLDEVPGEFPSGGGFGARSLTATFTGPATNPSIEIPGSAEINNSNLELGKTYKDMGLFAEAIEEFTHALEDPEASPAAAYNIALCHIELGENDDAQSSLEQLSSDASVPAHWRSIASDKLSEISA